MNSYQRRKARNIAAVLLLAAAQSDTPFSSLPELISRMDDAQWRTISLQAGVPVADVQCRTLVVAQLISLA